MQTLLLVLFSFPGILALENGNDDAGSGGVGQALMPNCALNCIKEHVPNSGYDLLHVTCLCDPDFRAKHGPVVAPCLITLYDANEINKVQNAWRGQCEVVPSTPTGWESVKPEAEEDTSTATVFSPSLATATSAVAVDVTGEKIANILPRVLIETALLDFKFNFKLNSKTYTYTNTEINDEFDDEFNQLIRNWNRIHKLDDNQHFHRSAKAGIGIGVSFGVVGMACLAATLWLRTRTKAPPVTPAPVIEHVGKAELPATTARPLHVSEIDGREAPQELAA
ncbi:hypothetical protein CEP54_015197 [Fusarium duplospermum]|uniref:CFEM domain-containing protein n=1 Tax=Fusarium duplospermum TaxID=1325734 RepID=A0A428NQS5_9HYPO|nr:hypothetical protein CEP54_015197 [Fusarium duplospermum]